MSDRQTVWVDTARCTGCSACVEVCSAGAITLLNGKARVDEETCTGCVICVDVCPEDAIQPIVSVQGELIPVAPRPAPTAYRPGSQMEAAGAAVAVAGAGLLMKATESLVRTVGRWLARIPTLTRSSVTRSSAGSKAGAGRRARHRRRGR